VKVSPKPLRVCITVDTGTWFDAEVTVATVMEFITLLLWLRLWKFVKSSFWWSILVALVLVLVHCAAYWRGNLILAQATALSNSVLVLLIVLVARRGVYKTKQLERQVGAQHVTIETERGIAHELAQVLAGYRAKIEFYEKQAKDHNLPLSPTLPSSPESASASAA